METKDRSKEAQKIIKERLKQYFNEEQLSYLDDLGIEILNDYFSNHELRDLQDATPAVLKGFVDRNQKNEVKRRLTHISEEELETLIDWYKQECSEVEEVYDPAADVVIALEVKHKTMKNSPSVHWDGRFIVAIGDRLASTRTRLDGVIGYQSAVAPLNPDFVPTWSEFYEKREKLVAKHNEKVDESKKVYTKKVAEAEKQHKRDIKKYLKDLDRYELYKQGYKSKVKKPVEPVLKLPEYDQPAQGFEEPERPEVEQYLQPLDTRWSDVEREVIPEEHVMSSITNSDIVEVKRHIEATGYKKPVRKVADGYKVDQFILRKVK